MLPGKLLAKKQQQVLHFVIKGMMNKEIASIMNISLKTVEKHRQEVYKKTKCHSTIQLLKWSFRNCVITLDEFLAEP